jgi:mRNA-degrading endonuclease RelE of RelBE toxin-antitoxin system
VSGARQIRIAARAERDLARLPDKIATACVEFVFGPLAKEPYRVGRPLRGQLTGLYSARRGSYRIIYRIEDGDDHVEIIHIDHRRASGGPCLQTARPQAVSIVLCWDLAEALAEPAERVAGLVETGLRVDISS